MTMLCGAPVSKIFRQKANEKWRPVRNISRENTKVLQRMIINKITDWIQNTNISSLQNTNCNQCQGLMLTGHLPSRMFICYINSRSCNFTIDTRATKSLINHTLFNKENIKALEITPIQEIATGNQQVNQLTS